MSRKLKIRKPQKPNVNGLELESVIEGAFDRVEALNTMRHRLMLRRGPIDFELDPIREIRCWVKGPRWVPAVMCLGFVMGIAVVFNRRIPNQMIAISRESNIPDWLLWSKALSMSDFDPVSHGHRQALLAAVYTSWSDVRTLPAYRPARDDRVAALHLRHRVVELYPELRSPLPAGEDEVYVLPRTGAIYAGGAVQGLDYYYGGAYGDGLWKKNTG